MSILATLANTALTLTVWGPVYIAAAAVKADAIVVAVPIVVVHLIGFSTAILVTVRLTLSFFQMLRRLGSRDRAVGPAAGTVPEHSAEPLRLSCGKPRDVFGLRGIAR
jgi:Mg2+/citrate symporter